MSLFRIYDVFCKELHQSPISTGELWLILHNDKHIICHSTLLFLWLVPLETEYHREGKTHVDRLPPLSARFPVGHQSQYPQRFGIQ